MHLKRSFALFICSTLLAFPVVAGNGHMLHGFGPVNSSMGGAGVALPLEPVGSLMFNPALLASTAGHAITFSTEFFQDKPEFEVTLNDGSTGRAAPTTQIGILPSIGWTGHDPSKKMAFGFGLVAVAGFRTDSPENPDSILFDTPPKGFGRIYTDYRVTRIPMAVAYQVTPKLALGGSLNIYVGELAIAPLPHKVYDTVGGDDNLRFYPQGGNLVSSMAFSFQLGVLYTINPAWSVGGSFTTSQNYDPYVWNSTFADPTSPDFGKHRRLEYDLDGPMNAIAGVGYTPNDKISVAFDVMFIKYDGVAGFGSPGGIVDRVVYPFGWDDVWVYKAGIQYLVSNKLTLRAGYNYSDIPIRSEVVLTATGAPALFQHHFTAGSSFQLIDGVTADMGFYYVPKESVTGPFPDLDNNVLGTMTTSNQLTSVQIGLRWEF